MAKVNKPTSRVQGQKTKLQFKPAIVMANYLQEKRQQNHSLVPAKMNSLTSCLQRSLSFCPESPCNHPSGPGSLSGLPERECSPAASGAIRPIHSLTCFSFKAAWTEGLFSICWASLLFLALASCCCCCIEARIFTGIGCLFFSILVKLQGRTKWVFK